MSTYKALIKNLGPGLLFAGMSIGTSHLVLSTKAGAQYGWIMIIPIILANLFKYPFFEFGIRYTNVTNKSLVEGYLNRGKGYFWVFTFITLISVFTILAALYVVTAGLFINLFHLSTLDTKWVALGLFALISIILIIGRYTFLEKSLKYVVCILFAALLVTTCLVLFKGHIIPEPDFKAPSIFNNVGILFLIGLMGWMPTTVEASSWVSLWSLEKYETQKNKPTLKEALQEFNVGYIITALLAIFFLIIGWATLYGSHTEISGAAVVFADQLVQLFTAHIGEWAYIFIAISAFATMFSTCMTAHDAIARVSVDIISKSSLKKKRINLKNYYTVFVIILAVVNSIVISAFNAHMGQLVALATFVSFVLAPVIGYMNLKNVLSEEVPKKQQPSKGLQFLTYAGIVFLLLFSVYYCYIVLV